MKTEEKIVEEVLTMRPRELQRQEVLERLKQGAITVKDAAIILGLSERQIYRLDDNYKRFGAKSLISRLRGKPSNRQLDKSIKNQAIELVRQKYHDFGPTFANEKLLELHGISLSTETLRQLMIDEGIWKPRRRKNIVVHQQRLRRERFGELIQLDGSYHHWFEERGDTCCLLVLIDDATSAIVGARFVKHETTENYFQVCSNYFKQYGLPLAFYSDKHGVFRINRKEAIGGDGNTQFKRALNELDVELIYAESAQAKGRVERANQTLQDRLVKELRLRGISTMESANAYLPEFLDDLNERFAKAAKCEANAHRPLVIDDDTLAHILCIKTTRVLSKNLECRMNNVTYQIKAQGPRYGLHNATIDVHILKDGEVMLLYKGEVLPYRVFEAQNDPGIVKNRHQTHEALENLAKLKPKLHTKPAADHPWRRFRVSPEKEPYKQTVNE